MSVNDRRQADRAPTLISVHFKTDEAAGNCTATDISETGLFLFMMSRPRLGSDIYLVFTLPGFENLPPLKVKGKVARIVEKGEGPTPGVGVEFSDIFSESKESIRSFVRAVLDPEYSPPLDTDPPSCEYRIGKGKIEPVIPKEAATPPPPISQAAGNRKPPPVPADTRPAPKGWVPLTNEELEEMSREIPVGGARKKAKPSHGTKPSRKDDILLPKSASSMGGLKAASPSSMGGLKAASPSSMGGLKAASASSMGGLKAASMASKEQQPQKKDIVAHKDVLAHSIPPSSPHYKPMGLAQERKSRHYKLSYGPDSKKSPRVKRAGKKEDKALSQKLDGIGILARFNLTPARLVMILFLLVFVSFVLYIIIKNVSWCMKLTSA
ncbi:MAG: PilZ domain-containing protein [Pseudomonadota bacterium]